jgi:hypothetical protein
VVTGFTGATGECAVDGSGFCVSAGLGGVDDCGRDSASILGWMTIGLKASGTDCWEGRGRGFGLYTCPCPWGKIIFGSAIDSGCAALTLGLERAPLGLGFGLITPPL